VLPIAVKRKPTLVNKVKKNAKAQTNKQTNKNTPTPETGSRVVLTYM